MSVTFEERLHAMPFGERLNTLVAMVDEISQGRDETLAALRAVADQVGAELVLVGGAAVIRHGYQRTTKDRDVLVDYRRVRQLADTLWDDPNWERLEIREYTFVYKPTGLNVDFLVSRDLITMGRPYYFPDVNRVETVAPIEGIPVIGLNDLVWLKLLAGRLRDLADIMELCKLHQGEIDPDRVLATLEKEDDDLREILLDIIRKAPQELAGEQRLGQGEVFQQGYRPKRQSDESNPPQTN
jgi:hypothetical protein